jgi:hypothetical protein
LGSTHYRSKFGRATHLGPASFHCRVLINVIAQKENTMSHFMHVAIDDMRSGRQSWRVFTIFSIPAFVLSVVFAVIRGFVK